MTYLTMLILLLAIYADFKLTFPKEKYCKKKKINR